MDSSAFYTYLVDVRGKKPGTARLYTALVEKFYAAFPEGAPYEQASAWIVASRVSFASPAIRYFSAWAQSLNDARTWVVTSKPGIVPIEISETHQAIWMLLRQKDPNVDPATLTWAKFWPIWSRIQQQYGESEASTSLTISLEQMAKDLQRGGRGGALVFAAFTGSSPDGGTTFTIEQLELIP